jgi:four helix bundle protein
MPQDICDRTFKFAVKVVRLCNGLSKTGASGRVLGNQLLRSATSIGANMEEAQASPSRADFNNKVSISCKEARETLYWLRLLKETDAESVSSVAIDDLIDESSQIVAILTAILKSSKKQ